MHAFLHQAIKHHVKMHTNAIAITNLPGKCTTFWKISQKTRVLPRKTPDGYLPKAFGLGKTSLFVIFCIFHAFVRRLRAHKNNDKTRGF